MQSNFQALVKLPRNLNSKLAGKIAKAVLAELKQKPNWELSVVVAGPAYIKKLNQKYRHKNKVTDVLSFSSLAGSDMALPGRGSRYLGDIVLCFDQIKKQAKIFGHSSQWEFSLLLIHGILHLFGYEDETQKQYQKMEKIQNKVLIKIYGKYKAIN